METATRKESTEMASKNLTGKDVLKIKMVENDAGAKTIREYFVSLLWELWVEGESFSGKRPFGNSGWEYEIYQSLAKAGAIEATYYPKDDDEEEPEIDSYDEKTANRLIKLAIESLRK